MAEQIQNIGPASQKEAVRQADNNGKIGLLQKWAFRSGLGDNRATGVLRSFFRVIFIIIHEFSETKISLRASALTYSIVLSLVPMLAMSTAVLKGLGGGDQLQIAAYQFIDQLEPETSQAPTIPASTVEDQAPQDAESVAAAKEKDDQQAKPTGPGVQEDDTKAARSLTSHLRSAVDTIFNYVDRTNFAALGAFGIAGLLLAVILVFSTIEEAMNAIWHTVQSRSFFRKTMDYLALLILLPISINVALAGDAVLASPTILAHLHTFIPSEWVVRMMLKLLPFLFIILTLMVMYMFFPNVRVKTHAAFFGAVFAGIFWFLVQKAYIILQVGVAKYNAIYGSFATVPLFLIWVQLGWTFILLGACLAYAVQNRSRYYLPGSGTSPQRNLQLAFDILNTIYHNFAGKNATTFDDLVKANPGNRQGNIVEITEKLIQAGMIHATDDDRQSYVPAAPSDGIEAREVVQLILGHEEIQSVGGHFSSEVLKAAESAIPPEAFPVFHPAGPDKKEAPDHE